MALILSTVLTFWLKYTERSKFRIREKKFGGKNYILYIVWTLISLVNILYNIYLHTK